MKRQTLALGFVVLSALVACQSATKASSSPTSQSPEAIEATLDGSALAGDAAWQSAIHSDKPLLLVFWQSWCGSCVQEAPMVQRAFQRYGSRLAVAGVVSGPDDSVDAEHLNKTILRLGLTYPQFRDRDLHLTRLFQVTGTPDVILLDRNRKVVFRGHELPKSIESFL